MFCSQAPCRKTSGKQSAYSDLVQNVYSTFQVEKIDRSLPLLHFSSNCPFSMTLFHPSSFCLPLPVSQLTSKSVDSFSFSLILYFSTTPLYHCTLFSRTLSPSPSSLGISRCLYRDSYPTSSFSLIAVLDQCLFSMSFLLLRHHHFVISLSPSRLTSK